MTTFPDFKLKKIVLFPHHQGGREDKSCTHIFCGIAGERGKEKKEEKKAGSKKSHPRMSSDIFSFVHHKTFRTIFYFKWKICTSSPNTHTNMATATLEVALTAGADSLIHIWQPKTGAVITTLRGNSSEPSCLCVCHPYLEHIIAIQNVRQTINTWSIGQVA